jgi:hypothetical protein
MKIVINEYGLLYLERAGTLKEQFCPFAHGQTSCGDWCPHFGEPDDDWLVLTCGKSREWEGTIEDQRKVKP